MSTAIFSDNFGATVDRFMQQKTHLLMLGDSQTFEGRLNSLASDTLLKVAIPTFRQHYMVIPAANASPVECPGYTPSFVGTNVTVTSYGATSSDTTAGVTPKLLRGSQKLAAAANLADLADLSNGAGQGIFLQRQQSAADYSNDNRAYSWPCNNGARAPWFHGQHVKAKLIIQQLATSGWLQVDIACARVGLTTSTVSAYVTSVLSAADAVVSTSWTAALADGGGYQTNTAGLLNDHYVQIRARATTGYNENGLSLVVMGAVVARTDSGGTIQWNADNTGFGYDYIGRPGASVADFANFYAVQAQWQQYFTQTVLVPDAHSTLMIMLGHNVNGAGEQSAGTLQTQWSTNYTNLITMIKAAYAAAFPSGTLRIVLIVPWICTAESNYMQSTGTSNQLQEAVEAIAASNGCAWCSFYNYFNQTPPFYPLHSSTPANGALLALAFRDMLDRSTNFKYSSRGTVLAPAIRNRSWR